MSVDFNGLAAKMLTQMALVNASISTVGTLQEATPITLRTVYAAVQNALAPFDSAIAAYDADIITTSVGGVILGTAAPTLASILLTQSTDVGQQSLAVIGRAYVARAAVNVLNSPG